MGLKHIISNILQQNVGDSAAIKKGDNKADCEKLYILKNKDNISTSMLISSYWPRTENILWVSLQKLTNIFCFRMFMISVDPVQNDIQLDGYISPELIAFYLFHTVKRQNTTVNMSITSASASWPDRCLPGLRST